MNMDDGWCPNTAEHRKLLLLGFAVMGSVATILFVALPSTSVVWLLSALLAILAIVAFGASVVAMNAYLPSLARTESSVREKAAIVERLRHAGPAADSESDLNFDTRDATTVRDPILQSALESYNEALSKATSRISSTGIAWGYAAGIALLCVALIPVTVLNGSTFSLRLAVSLSGIWWLLFSIPTAIWLPSGRSGLGGSLSWEQRALTRVRAWRDRDRDQDDEPTVLNQIKMAWIRLGNMLRPSEMARLRNTFWFLAAWFLLSDGGCRIIVIIILHC